MSKKKERLRNNLDDLEDMTRILWSGAHIVLGGVITTENILQNAVAEALENIAYVGVNIWPILVGVGVSMTRGAEDTCSFIYRMASNKEQLLGLKQLGEAKENIDQRLSEYLTQDKTYRVTNTYNQTTYIIEDGNITVKTFKYDGSRKKYEDLTEDEINVLLTKHNPAKLSSEEFGRNYNQGKTEYFKVGYVESSSEQYKVADLMSSCSPPTEASLKESIGNSTNENKLNKARCSIIKELAAANPSNQDLQELARDNEAYLVSVTQETRRLGTNKKLSKRVNPSIPKTSYGVSMMGESAKSAGGAVKRLIKGGKVDKRETLYQAINKKEKTNKDGSARAVQNPLTTLATPVTHLTKLVTERIKGNAADKSKGN
jgi:hypothetical protein